MAHPITRAALHVAIASAALPAAALAEDLSPRALLSLSLEQLSNIEVTSVSKKSEKASEAAAAIYVITADDIRRMGATSIPEALRGVPGMHVAQAGSHQWVVTARGFSDQFANKLLVLIDGRTVYTPLFNGVWWDVQDTMLEDIERIEVIRGPGATLWGANAVNGVINIITKNSRGTEGGIVTAGIGNQERLAATRYGVKMGDDAYVRVYAKYNDREELRNLAGNGARDEWNKEQGGFRADWKQGEGDSFTLQGDVYHMEADAVMNLPSFTAPPVVAGNQDIDNFGANVLARWTREISKESQISLQAYADNTRRKYVYYQDTINTFDVDFQHSWTALARNEIVWGAGWRMINNYITDTLYYSLQPDTRSDQLFSAFLQDKIAIVPDHFFITLGSKFEHNDYSGFELQPSARLTIIPDDKQTFWASVSHAVKTPYRNTSDGSLTFAAFPVGAPTGFLGTDGNPQLESEKLMAYEMGYRIQPSANLSFDAAMFYNVYTDLFIGQMAAAQSRTWPGLGTFGFVPIVPVNNNSARSRGFELAANWEVTDYWQLSGSYSYLDLKFEKQDTLGFPLDGKSPQQQLAVRSTMALPYDLEMNNQLYVVDQLPGIGIAEYVRFDARLAWHPRKDVELSLVGQNLFDDKHPEFTGFVYQNTSQVPRSAYVNLAVRF